MKFTYWILLALVIFNGMITVVTSLNVFNQAYEPENTDDLSAYENATMSETGLFENILGVGNGLRIEALIAGAATIAGAIGIAYLTHSPVPLGIGAYIALFVTIWTQTYLVIGQFGFEDGATMTLLSIGMLCMGIIVVITGIEMAVGGHST